VPPKDAEPNTDLDPWHI